MAYQAHACSKHRIHELSLPSIHRARGKLTNSAHNGRKMPTIELCKRRWRLTDLLVLLFICIVICILLELTMPGQLSGLQDDGLKNNLPRLTNADRQEIREETLREEIDTRVANMDDICDMLVEKEPCFNDIYEDTLKHLYILEEYKLMFCYIPKVGCSNWKRILMILENRARTIADIDSREAHARNNLTMLEDVSPEKRQWYIDNYRKFMFVRHPLSRIVSAYKNKFKDLKVFRAAPIIIRRYGMRIVKKYRKDATAHEIKTGENVTWNEWLQYIADPASVVRFDRHWKEMYKLCSPCAINYDYVGKLENINDEADFILDKMKVSHLVRYPGKENSHPTNTSLDKVLDVFKSATQYQLQRISEVFGLDFCMFGYDKPDILP